MAETLSAILLVTKSAKESTLVFRWPPSPTSSPRLSRPKPSTISVPLDLDNPWKASNYPGLPLEDIKFVPDDASDYEWKRPTSSGNHMKGYSHPASHPTSGRNSPIKEPIFVEPKATDEYDHVYTYSSDFLGVILCPQQAMCHQKFELIVDDLAFIGHPVCAESDVNWRFKPEKLSKGSSARGRESRNIRSQHPSPDRASSSDRVQFATSSWLQLFHLVFVLDLPDPSSSASANMSKYYDIVYEQVAFVVTAVLFQEQVCSNFVERECGELGRLKEHCISKGEPFVNFVAKALAVSSIASTMKNLFEAIKSNTLAYLSINNLPLELQLPPHLDQLLHNTDETEMDFVHHPDEEGVLAWGPDMIIGWRLPTLAPWKSLLLLEDTSKVEMAGKNMPTTHEDRILVDGLVRFLETASVTLSLADMANLLDWDLEMQIFPTVRWLVQHRRAKVVDLVHSGLKTVFTLPPKFDYPLAQLMEEFDEHFSPHGIPPLPKILATIATSISKQSDNHFFASVVQSKKENIPIYQDVILWMLKRDMLITLHLRIRIVVTKNVKIHVRKVRDRKKKSRQEKEKPLSGLRQELEANSSIPPRGYAHGVGHGAPPWLPFSPKSAHRHFQKMPPSESIAKRREVENNSNLAGNGDEHPGLMDEEYDNKGMDDEDDEEEDDEDHTGWDTVEDHLWPSIIPDPGRATPLQRRWLSAMSEGKPAHVAKRFELINQYFDGKKTDDEILYRAEISRKQLREVLHHYDEYLQTFLHPS